jgi:hypothetical protein
MIKGISLSETEQFICKDDDPNSPTKWKLGVIDSLIMAEIQDLITLFEPDGSGRPDAPAKTKLCLNVVRAEAVRYGLKGWENFCDEVGSQIIFRTEKRNIGGKAVDAVADELMRIIPFTIVSQLGDRILQKNRFSEEEAKN